MNRAQPVVSTPHSVLSKAALLLPDGQGQEGGCLPGSHRGPAEMARFFPLAGLCPDSTSQSPRRLIVPIITTRNQPAVSDPPSAASKGRNSSSN